MYNHAFLLLVVLLAGKATAEFMIVFEEDQLPVGHGYPEATACIAYPASCYTAVMTGPEGDPPSYTAIWTNDDQVPSPLPILSFTLEFTCGDQEIEITRQTVIETFYIPGPAFPSDMYSNWSDLEGWACPGSWVDDLRILREGNSIRLEWSTVPNALQYRVYILDDPAGDFAQATLLAEVGQLEYEFNMPAAPAAQTFFVTAVFEP